MPTDAPTPKVTNGETMRAVQSPDIYSGETCDQHKPRWLGSADGDKEGDTPIGDEITLGARTFPPGTVVIVKEPVCPECGEVPSEADVGWECGCDFDWHAWTEDQFS